MTRPGLNIWNFDDVWQRKWDLLKGASGKLYLAWPELLHNISVHSALSQGSCECEWVCQYVSHPQEFSLLSVQMCFCNTWADLVVNVRFSLTLCCCLSSLFTGFWGISGVKDPLFSTCFLKLPHLKLKCLGVTGWCLITTLAAFSPSLC